MAFTVTAPWWKDVTTFGFHDWDSQTAHRYLVKKSLLEHFELPFWNPYACGGFPAWGYVEADTVLVSPWLLAYLLLPVSLALRVEVLGMGLLGAAGAYAFAGRFTKSHAARALAAALWAVNGRWGLQTASGHTWHLAYAWLPWCLFFFERARLRGARTRELALLAGSLAMLVYAGGIYPLPHTVLALGLYALVLAAAERSLRPLVTLAGGGLAAIGLAAPKLLPMLDTFGKAPRLIESRETLDLGALLSMLTSRDQAFYSRPAKVAPYGWHEWGIYVSAAGVVVLLVAFVFVQGKREAALKLVGLVFVALGFGAFHPYAPWTLLHEHAPVFRSQHVPSRFLYPAVLVLGVVAAAGLGRAIERRSLRAPWLDLAAGVLVLWLAIDVAGVAQKPMANAMWMVAPPIPAGRAFHFEQEPPFQYKKRDWAGPMYLAMLGNTGVINCYGAPPFDRRGAKPVGDPAYRGEVHLEGGAPAPAPRLAAWSPNRAVVELDPAPEGALLVYNMNFDEGWRASVDGADAPVVNVRDTLAVRLPAGARTVTFRYRPPHLAAGLALAAAARAGRVARRRRERRIEEGRA